MPWLLFKKKIDLTLESKKLIMIGVVRRTTNLLTNISARLQDHALHGPLPRLHD